MNPAAYEELDETESTHWWFVGRRAIVTAVIGRLALPKRARILEIGCGTGGNIEMLSKHGVLSAMETDAAARAIANRKANGACVVEAGSCPDDLPFTAASFDLVCMFDVLEHIDEDVATLAAVRRLLAPGGRALITVPAYAWMWSGHDEFLHHKRRYTASTLEEKARRAGLCMVKQSYFNAALFPLAVLVRLQARLFRRNGTTGGAVPPSPINALFGRILAAERRVVARSGLPFGLSLLCVLERNGRA